MGLRSARDTIVAKLEEVAKISTNLEELAYAGASLGKLVDISFDGSVDAAVYTIGYAGEIGFGVGAIYDELLPAGFMKLTGHEDTAHPNYSKVMDLKGSIFFNTPPFWYKMVANVITISPVAASGFVIHEAFLREPNGFLHSGFMMGREGANMVSKQGLDPLSTSSTHNPISTLGVANNYGGWIDACHNAGYVADTIFQWNALTMLTLAQSQSGVSSAYCAFMDVAPFFPKGNNNNALKDVNDTSVSFAASGYSNCALTGSGSKFAKTTHNGQDCGVSDVNGNMFKIVTGLTYLAKTGATGANGSQAVAMPAHGLAVNDVIYFGGTPSSGTTYNTGAYTVTAVGDANNFTIGTVLSRAILATDGVYSARYFRILKRTVKANTLTSTNLLDEANYDLLDLTGIVGSNSGAMYYGNGTETVLNFSTDTNSVAYKLAACGLPTTLGTSAGETAAFGNDYIYKYLRHGLVPVVGGYWDNAASAGSFTLYLGTVSVHSTDNVGGFASVSL